MGIANSRVWSFASELDRADGVSSVPSPRWLSAVQGVVIGLMRLLVGLEPATLYVGYPSRS